MNKIDTLNGLLHLRQLTQRIQTTERDLAAMRESHRILQIGVYATCEHKFAADKGYEHEGLYCEVCGVTNWTVAAHVQAWDTIKQNHPQSYQAVLQELELTNLKAVPG